MDVATEAAIGRWAELFNAGEHFEAHEALEEAWLRAGGPEKGFLKGLIHAAVALVHCGRGNLHGTRAKYASARRYLLPYAPVFAGVDVAALLEELDRFFGPLAPLPAGSPLPPPARPWPRVTVDREEERP